MALINCPECGDKVSDTAETCPHCGYNIKKFIQNKREEIQRKENLDNITKYFKEQNKKEDEEIEKGSAEISISKIDLFFNKSTKLGLACTFFAVFLLLCLLLNQKYSTNSINELYLFVVIFLVGGFVNLNIGLRQLSDIQKIFQKHKNNEKKLKEEIFKYYKNKEDTDRIMNQMIIKSFKKNKTDNGAKCPYCNSTNTTKITVAKRSVSTYLFGLGSSKVGKQWHCNNCKSDF